MTDYVLRRGPMRDVGVRYFNDRGPMTPNVANAARFLTAEDAERQRLRMKEPALWEALPVLEAEQREHVATPRRNPRAATLVGALGMIAGWNIPGMDAAMGDIRRRK